MKGDNGKEEQEQCSFGGCYLTATETVVDRPFCKKHAQGERKHLQSMGGRMKRRRQIARRASW